MVDSIEVPPGELYIGGEVVDGERGDPLLLEASDLTTHGVIVGMTGSGKTGLGVDLLEEALLSGIPAIVIDPKGDMGNLELVFPDLAPGDFEPWVSPEEAERDGVSVADHAAAVAEMWRNGLADWGIGPDRLRRLRDGVETTIYTPGSTAGVPLDVIGSLNVPGDMSDMETVRDQIEGFVTSLLALVDIDADPLSSREHILLSNLIEASWTAGRDLDLAGLVGQVLTPPLRKLGVFELDDFFPPDDRTALAMRLNGVIASPSFASWIEGAPLDIDTLTRAPDGRPAAAIISLGHLSEQERQFVVTLVMSELITWMRAQPGSGELRLLVYMDEVFGYLPPTANPPSKKPLLTLLKQARAFGVGLVLSTQNPVDLDYKALSNTGTWMIGRLQTERDKLRLTDGLTAAAGDVDVAALDTAISGLPKRQFVLHQTRGRPPRQFGTRWAMSYLAGPLTRAQIADLTRDAAARTSPGAEVAPTPDRVDAATDAPEPEPETAPLAEDEVATMPKVADSVDVRYVDAAAPWANEIGARPGGRRHEPVLVARVAMRFDETRADLVEDQEWECVLHPVTDRPDPAEALHADWDPRDLRDDAPDDVVYAITDARIDTKTFFTRYRTALRDHLHRTRSLTIGVNRELKLWGRPGESETDFARRCQDAADDRADEQTAKLRDKYEGRVDRAELALAKAEDRLREIQTTAEARSRDELLSGAGSLLGALLGGRGKGLAGRLARSLGGAGRRRGRADAARERLVTAQNRIDEARETLLRLDDELRDELAEIGDHWNDVAGAIETVDVGLEKNDIAVDDLVLAWLPVD